MRNTKLKLVPKYFRIYLKIHICKLDANWNLFQNTLGWPELLLPLHPMGPPKVVPAGSGGGSGWWLGVQ